MVHNKTLVRTFIKKILPVLLLFLNLYDSEAQFIQSHKWRAAESGGTGFVPGFCLSKTEKNVIYARTDVGGAYRWDETNKSWLRISDWVKSSEWPLMGIQSIITDPSTPGRVYMMGGMYNNSPSAIMRSDDYGKTFKRFVVPFQITGTASPAGERLCVDPNNPSVLYCGTHKNGLWKSTNSGETWTQITTFTNAVSVTSGETLVVPFVIADGSTGTSGTTCTRIIAGLSRLGNNTIYISDDAGSTWQPVTGLPTTSMPQRAVLSTDGMVYTTYSNQVSPTGSGTSGGFFRVNPATKAVTDITPQGIKTNGYCGVTVDKNNANQIIITNTNGVRWNATGMYGERIWRTKDGGSNWTDLASSSLVVMDYQGFGYAASVNPHWVTNVEIDPFNSNRFFFNSGNGVYRCENLGDFDSGKTITFQFSTKGLVESVVFDFVSPGSGAQLLQAIGDYAGFRHTQLDQPGERFSPAGGANNLCIDAATTNPNVVVRTTSNPASGALYSLDNGVSWKTLGSYAVSDSVYAGNIAVSADGTYMVWAPKDKPMRVTFDNGASWYMCQGTLPPNNLRPVSDKVNVGKFYVFNGMNLYASEDGGWTYSAFSVATCGMPASTSYGTIRTFPGKEGEIWFPLNENGLYSSKWSGGKPQFTKIVNVDYCRAVAFGMAKPGSGQPATLFIHGKVKTSAFDGIFRSDDMGATWIQVNDPEHEFAGISRSGLVGDPRTYGRVYMNTGGGLGVIYGDIDGAVYDGSIETPATTIKVGASQSYTTIQTAYNSISSNLSSSVLIELQSDYSPSSEIFPVVFSAKTGASATNYILVRPADGVQLRLESPNTIFSFNGARYVKIDGRPTGVGVSKSLILSNTSTATGAKTVEFLNDAFHNTLRYCNVLGSANSTTTGTIVIGTTSGTVSRSGTTGDFYGSGNLHTTIDNCNIGNGAAGWPVNAVYLKGTPTYTNEGTVISNNNIYNFISDVTDVKSCGILNDMDCQTTEITNNHFYQTGTKNLTGGSLIYPIYINTAGLITSITNNFIGGTNDSGSGVWTIQSTGATRFCGIYINSVKSGASIGSFNGNRISGIDLTSYSAGNGTDGVVAGIILKAGNVVNSAETSPNEVSNITLRFGTTMSGSNGLCGYTYFYGAGACNLGYIKVNNLTAIPVGANAGIISGKVVGIYTGNAYGTSCKAAEVHDLVCGTTGSQGAHQVYGIYSYSGSNRPNTIERNFVYNLNAVSTGASVVAGLSCGAGTGVLTMKNNMVCLGNDMTSGAALYGIYKNTTGADVFIHNSVYIGGSVSGTTQNTYAFMRDVTTENTLTGNNIRNNIFVNKRTGGDIGKHFVISSKLTSDYSNPYPVVCNFNCYDMASGANNVFGSIASTGFTFADWKTTTKWDNNSINADPKFVDATNAGTPDLSIKLNSSIVDQKGDATLTATDDYFGATRTALSPCDIGAYAYIYDPRSVVNEIADNPLSVFTGNSCMIITGSGNKTANIFSIDGRLIQKIRLQSDRQIVFIHSGIYFVRVDEKVAKVIVR